MALTYNLLAAVKNRGTEFISTMFFFLAWLSPQKWWKVCSKKKSQIYSVIKASCTFPTVIYSQTAWPRSFRYTIYIPTVAQAFKIQNIKMTRHVKETIVGGQLLFTLQMKRWVDNIIVAVKYNITNSHTMKA